MSNDPYDGFYPPRVERIPPCVVPPPAGDDGILFNVWLGRTIRGFINHYNKHVVARLNTQGVNADPVKVEATPNFKRVEFRNVKDQLVLTLEPQYDWLKDLLIQWLIEADLMQQVNACEPVKKPKFIMDFSDVFDY